MSARYCVVIEELHPHGGWVVRRMLVAKFVAKGDAMAYAMDRRDKDTKGYEWVVETTNAIRPLHTFRKGGDS